MDNVVKDIPKTQEIHVILDNYCTHKKNGNSPAVSQPKLLRANYLFLCYNVAHKIRSINMTVNAVVRARIDEHIKEEASVVLASMGLTVSDAFRMLLTRIAKEKSLPFEPLIPNQVTIDAMKEARRGKLKSFDSIRSLMDDLNEED